MNELVSIIVPIYNSEKHIKRCVDSIVNQTYKNIEIVLVNDGSTDNSLNVIKEFTDKRIVLIDKNNSGASDTRNVGIQKSRGKYVAFIDSDDWIEKDYILNLLQIIYMNKSDIIISGYTKVSDKQIKIKKLVNKVIYLNQGEEDKTYDILYSNNGSSVWGKLYKYEILQNVIMRKIKIGEDMLFNIEALSMSHKIFISDYVGYYYNDNSESITKKYISDIMDDLENILKIIELNSITYIFTIRIINEYITNSLLYSNEPILKILAKIGTYERISYVLKNKNNLKIINLFNMDKRIYNKILVFCINNKLYILLAAIQIIKRKLKIKEVKNEKI